MREYHAGYDEDEGDVERCLSCDEELDDSNRHDSGICHDCHHDKFVEDCYNADYDRSMML